MKWIFLILQLFLVPVLFASYQPQPQPQPQSQSQTSQQFDQPQRLKSTIATSFPNSSSPFHHEQTFHSPASLSLVAETPSAAITTRNARSISKTPPPETLPPLHPINCRQLRMGQFLCPQAEIDLETQQPAGCTAANLAPVNCTLREGLICDDDPLGEEGAEDVLNGANSTTSTSKRRKPRYVNLAVACDYTNGYSFEVTLLLSVFLGFLGADRFYLGYGALGLLKLSTLGFLFLGHFVDILLIAMQIVLPADGSGYIIKQYGPRLNILRSAGGYPLPSPNATRVFESQYEHYFYWPANYSSAGVGGGGGGNG